MQGPSKNGIQRFRSFPVRSLYSFATNTCSRLVVSLPGAFATRRFRSLELSQPVGFATWSFRNP